MIKCHYRILEQAWCISCWLRKTVLQKLNHLFLDKQQWNMPLPGSSSFPSPFSSLCSAKVTEEPLGSAKNFWLWRWWQKDKAYVRFILGSQISPFLPSSAEQWVGGLERRKMWLWPSACSLWPWWKLAQPCPSCRPSCCVLLPFPCSLRDIFYLWCRGFQGWHSVPQAASNLPVDSLLMSMQGLAMLRP